VAFVKSLLDRDRLNVLDVGCSTGSLAISLARQNHRITGIDLDRKMITIAKQRAASENLPVVFLAMDMMKLESTLGDQRFHQILCLGNTLVHLQTLSEMQGFLSQVFRCLDFGGYLVGQIVNYDRVIQRNVRELPVIETEKLVFERFYSIPMALGVGQAPGHGLQFITRLWIKEARKEVCSKTTLYPLRFEQLRRLLIDSGFSSLGFYSGYNKQEYDLEDFSLLFVGKKEKESPSMH
jgi:ubiquinone/menaquinone biosynthesis C-methylase UbiE